MVLLTAGTAVDIDAGVVEVLDSVVLVLVCDVVVVEDKSVSAVASVKVSVAVDVDVLVLSEVTDGTVDSIEAVKSRREKKRHMCYFHLQRKNIR